MAPIKAPGSDAHLEGPNWERGVFQLDKKKEASIIAMLTELYGAEKAKKSYGELHRVLAEYHAHKSDVMFQWEKENKGADRFTEEDIILITYGDLIKGKDEKPLETLRQICHTYFKGVFSTIHILPFFPYSSDRGFSIMDFKQVDRTLGNWEDILCLKDEFKLMFDGVFNHVSSKSFWFQEFMNGNPRFLEFFTHFDREEDIPEEELKLLLRPRTSSVLTPYYTYYGKKYLWTTFSPDQIDLKFQTPDVLIRITATLLFYVRKGADIIRLDAVTYLWDEVGTSGAHLSQTHTIIKLFRTILDAVAPHVALITETNVPHEDNISYFGNGKNEAQMVYNFALPPLVLHTFQTGDCTKLNQWAAILEPHCEHNEDITYFNFLDSHDGIGVMGARGILSEEEITAMGEKVVEHGGLLSNKANSDGSESLYEMNITFYSALNKPTDPLTMQLWKYIAARSIALVIMGVPGIYLHGFLGSENDIQAARESGVNRSINRMELKKEIVTEKIENLGSREGIIANEISLLIHIRRHEKAFHPSAPQKAMNLSPALFSLARISKDGIETIIALVNITDKHQHVHIPLPEYDLPEGTWHGLLTGLNYNPINGKINLDLAPYQIAWLKNTLEIPE